MLMTGWVQLHILVPTLVKGLTTSAQQHWDDSSNVRFLLVTLAVVLSLLKQSQLEETLPFKIISLQAQFKGLLVFKESLWHRVRGGFGTQQVQFYEGTPPKVWFKQEHWVLVLKVTFLLTSMTPETFLLQSHNWVPFARVKHWQACTEEFVALQTGATAVIFKRVLGWQQEHYWVTFLGKVFVAD